jgi:hypothetical protein
MRPLHQPEDIMQIELGKLLDAVEALRRAYPAKRFTLDGRLVGDIGEVLAQRRYEIELLPGLQHHHDAHTADGKQVQIKATMRDSLTFPADHVPDHYLGLKINGDGSTVELFNGPGAVIAEHLRNRARPRNNQHSLNANLLRELQKQVAVKSVKEREALK